MRLLLGSLGIGRGRESVVFVTSSSNTHFQNWTSTRFVLGPCSLASKFHGIWLWSFCLLHSPILSHFGSKWWRRCPSLQHPRPRDNCRVILVKPFERVSHRPKRTVALLLRKYHAWPTASDPKIHSRWSNILTFTDSPLPKVRENPTSASHPLLVLLDQQPKSAALLPRLKNY